MLVTKLAVLNLLHPFLFFLSRLFFFFLLRRWLTLLRHLSSIAHPYGCLAVTVYPHTWCI